MPSTSASEIVDLEPRDEKNAAIVQRWCENQGSGWYVKKQAGRGGTAPVFVVATPKGDRAFKLYDKDFSSGSQRDIQTKSVAKQVALGEHDCPYLIKTVDGGEWESRLYLVMHLAEGNELEKRLELIPRDKIRIIVDQIAQACQFLRENGLCHRDIKAANIFISDDFERTTLLDLSVMRDINDPIGLGTDHGNRLPMVATARYSPPEYLFRLIDPSPALWHAVDIYQLGALLHDLIMRKPIFSEEFAQSRDNRYRFAWIAAVNTPPIDASDVSADLLLLARRALDKEWTRRSALNISDFRNLAEMQRSQALTFLGLARDQDQRSATSLNASEIRKRLAEAAAYLDEHLTAFIRQLGPIPTHQNDQGAQDDERVVSLTWSPGPGAINAGGDVKFVLHVRLPSVQDKPVFETTATLEAIVEGQSKMKTATLPALSDGPIANSVLAENAQEILSELGRSLLAA